MLNPQKIVKRKSDKNLICYLTSRFGMNKTIFVFMVFTSIHVLDFMFWVRVIYVNNKIRIIVWLGVVTLRSLVKGTPWKFWFDPLWILKWLPLDRGYFKFYFYKGESPLIISCHTYLLTRKLVILFQVIFVLPCILFSLKCPVIQCY